MQEDTKTLNLTKELSLLIIFTSRVAIAIRACSGIEDDNQLEDIRALSECIHNFDYLSRGILEENKFMALNACEFLIKRLPRDLAHSAFTERRKLHFHVDPLPVLADIEAKLRASTPPIDA